MNNTASLRKITGLGVMAALSIVLVWLLHFPIFPQAPFLEYDPADIPILICTFLYGPWTGLFLTLAVSIVQGITVSASSGAYGILMHLIATGSFVIVAGFIAKESTSQKRVATALFCGTLTMGAVMAVANLIVTPLFMGTPVEVVKSMLLPVILPFNLIKAGLNSVATFFLYERVGKILKVNFRKNPIGVLKGKVVSGQHMGEGFGFPTANLPAEALSALKKGVYVSRAELEDSRSFQAVSNLGVHPSVGEADALQLETYLFDFDETLYDREITVTLLKFLREEQKFSDSEALKAQIQSDVEAAKGYFDDKH